MYKEFWVIGNGKEFLCKWDYKTDNVFYPDIYTFTSEQSAIEHIKWAESRDWGWRGMYEDYKPMKVIVNYEIN